MELQQTQLPLNTPTINTLGNSDKNIIDKTPNPLASASQTTPISSAGNTSSAKATADNMESSNILNRYRAVTYNFTLAAFNVNNINNPKAFEDNDWKNYIVLSSKGKGQDYAINPGSGAASKLTTANTNLAAVSTDRSATVDSIKAAQQNVDYLNAVPGIIKGFNEKSPGKFDMYIDNVEFENLMTPTSTTNATLTSSIKFEVYEPYSINGFTEALHAAAIAAGYTTYSRASFILKMEFMGYPIEQDLPNPEPIKDATRYFVFGFTGFEVSLSETGTKYNCTGVPYNELPLGKSTTVAQPITANGLTVEEILSDLMEQLTKRSQKESEKIASNEPYDQFAIKFKVYDAKGQYTDAASLLAGQTAAAGLPRSAIADAFISEPGGKGNVNVNMVSPDAGNVAGYVQSKIVAPSGGNKVSLQYRDGTSLVDIITNTIRDSTYLRNKLKDIKNNIDDDGFFEYFLINTEIESLGYSLKFNRQMFKYIFVVNNHRIHYTRLPTYGNQVIDQKKLDTTCLRTYNYIYTGNNVDVLSFKLNFNTLFFEAIPTRMGSGDFVNRSRTQQVADNSVTPNQNLAVNGQAPGSVIVNSSNPTSPIRVEPDATRVTPNSGGAANNEYNDYFALARNMHEAVVNSKGSMLLGEIAILGDPFYLISKGVGSYVPQAAKPGITKTGESMPMYSQVNVRINFKNVYDIGDLASGGIILKPKDADFSGVYRVTQAISSFKNGLFTQRLSILRVPGQLVNQPNQAPTNPAAAVINQDSTYVGY